MKLYHRPNQFFLRSPNIGVRPYLRVRVYVRMYARVMKRRDRIARLLISQEVYYQKVRSLLDVPSMIPA